MSRKKTTRKKNPFKAGIDHMLNVAGVECSATIGGVPTTFIGIFDELSNIEIDGGAEVLVRETTLTVKRSIAETLDRNLPIEVRVEVENDPLKYRIRDIQQTGDGSFVELKLALRTDVTQDYEDAYDEDAQS